LAEPAPPYHGGYLDRWTNLLRSRVNWRKQAWMLKNSLSTQNGPKLGDAKCFGIRKRRLNRIVMQSYFRQFLEKEFFNISNDVGDVKIY
jgi:hypothetical protein